MQSVIVSIMEEAPSIFFLGPVKYFSTQAFRKRHRHYYRLGISTVQ